MKWFSPSLATRLSVLVLTISIGSNAEMAVAQEDLQAVDPQAAEPISRSYTEPEIAESDRAHWAYRPILVAEFPSVSLIEWPRVGFDTLILESLESAGIAPAPEAESSILLRRLKLDLLGLPPTLDELAEYASDTEPNRYERWVDRFLASPNLGERWAQAWLDIARFAETDGFEHDRVRQDAWQYRDWVIRSLNEDMPYDQFVFHQLAGESSVDSRNHIATMFLLAGPDMPDINDQELRRHDRLNELTSTVGSALLGMQFQCAQCHDHKYDPLSQADFYRMRAVFESAVPKLQRDQAFVNLDSKSGSWQAEPRFFFRGDVRQPGPTVRPALPRIVCDDNPGATVLAGDRPRHAFARWLFDDANPLAARVIVNRLWQGHFGKGLFENPSDVGVTAASPSNLKVLDWLAAELRKQDWSMKALHRTIVLSSTYRQSSQRDPKDDHDNQPREDWASRLKRDPGNRLYSRFPRRRMDAETIRDAMLSVSGNLNLESGGKSVMPPLPGELKSTLLKGQWEASRTLASHARRSIYIFARRNLRFPILDVFDRPDAGASCAKRDRSTTATQALQMLNSQFTFECSGGLSERIQSNEPGQVSGDLSDRQAGVTLLFLCALGRNPSQEELDWMSDFLSVDGGSHERWQAACMAVLNTNEFIYID